MLLILLMDDLLVKLQYRPWAHTSWTNHGLRPEPMHVNFVWRVDHVVQNFDKLSNKHSCAEAFNHANSWIDTLDLLLVTELSAVIKVALNKLFFIGTKNQIFRQIWVSLLLLSNLRLYCLFLGKVRFEL